MNDSIRVSTVGVVGLISSVSLSTFNLYISIFVGSITLIYMTYKLFKEVYTDFSNWKAKHFPKKEVNLILPCADTKIFKQSSNEPKFD